MGVHLHPTYTLANRAEIEDEIERLIGLLDTADAPCEDLEPEHDSGIEDTAEGVGDHGRGLLLDLPIYGLDQSQEPVNYRAAERDHEAREQGLVRTATGWRRA